jgi:vitellogenic carboxypeptidase-like protein
MSKQEVTTALGIETSEGSKYVQCSSLLWKKFLVEFQENYSNMLPPILQNTTYRVLVYNGQFDLRCGVLGTSEWLRLLQWDGRASFNYADQQVFYDSQNKTVGIFKGFKNLTQVRHLRYSLIN